MVTLHDPNGSHPTLSALAALREDDALCDVSLVICRSAGMPPDLPTSSDHGEPRTFRAHRNVLAATSDYFRARLLGSFADSAGPKLTIGEMSPACFEVALRFMYSGAAQVAEDNLVQMLGVAAHLQVTL